MHDPHCMNCNHAFMHITTQNGNAILYIQSCEFCWKIDIREATKHIRRIIKPNLAQG